MLKPHFRQRAHGAPVHFHALVIENGDNRLAVLAFAIRLEEVARRIRSAHDYIGGMEDTQCQVFDGKLYPVVCCTMKQLNDIRLAFGAKPGEKGQPQGGEIERAVLLSVRMRRAQSFNPSYERRKLRTDTKP